MKFQRLRNLKNLFTTRPTCYRRGGGGGGGGGLLQIMTYKCAAQVYKGGKEKPV